MLSFYKNQWDFFKNYSLKFLIIVLFLFVILNVVTYFGIVLHPEIVTDLKKVIIDKMGGMEKIEKAMESNHSSFIYLVKNNVSISFILMAVGFIPFYLSSFIVFCPNAFLLGMLLGMDKIETGSAFTNVFITIAPHGITELLSIFITAALSFQLSHTIMKKIFSKRRKDISFIHTFTQVSKIFLTIAIPLLLISGLIEAYITPVIINHFS